MEHGHDPERCGLGTVDDQVLPARPEEKRPRREILPGVPDKRTFREKVGGTLTRVKFAYYKECDAKLVGIYADACEAYCSPNYPKSIICVYPGTKVRILQDERVAGIYGSTILLPGLIYDGCPNKNTYREIVARANALLCLISLPRLLKNQDWANEKTVVSVAKDIYGDERGGLADEIKMHFDFLGI